MQLSKKSKTTERIRLENVRLAFPNLWVPKAFEEGQVPRFEATFLLDPTDAKHAEQIKAMKVMIKALATEAYGTDIPTEIKTGDKIALKNNAYTDPETGQIAQRKKYNGYAGMYFISTAMPAEVVDRKAPGPKVPKVVYVPNTKEIDFYMGQPPVIDGQKRPVREGQPGAPYAGAYVNAIISFWAQPAAGKWGPRINANLHAVQFARDGDPFKSGGIDVDDAFEALEDQPGAAGGSPKFDDDIAF